MLGWRSDASFSSILFSLPTTPSPALLAVDHFRRKGNHAALTPAERHGLWIYESKGRCWRCHSGSNFTDEQFHNTGVSWGKDDLGRFSVSKNDNDRGKFKAPTLRCVALT